MAAFYTNFLRDIRDVVAMVRWFLFLGPKPTFERWAYWEKFDFWGAIADAVICNEGLTIAQFQAELRVLWALWFPTPGGSA